MKLFRAAITSAAFVAIGALSRADPAPTVHYAPAENLEHIDVSLIDTAKHEIDFAAYVLTDWPVMTLQHRNMDAAADLLYDLGLFRLRRHAQERARRRSQAAPAGVSVTFMAPRRRTRKPQPAHALYRAAEQETRLPALLLGRRRCQPLGPGGEHGLAHAQKPRRPGRVQPRNGTLGKHLELAL
jgi:hypothetical protein